MPCSPKRARLLLDRRRACVMRLRPFCIQLLDRTVDDCTLQSLTVKIDPGSKGSGLALVRVDDERCTHVVAKIEVTHRGEAIHAQMVARAGHRRRRRHSGRHRKHRCLNRRRPDDWLPPSLSNRVEPLVHWCVRLLRLAPVRAVALEHVRFDTLAVQEGESEPEFRRRSRQGSEVREFLLEKFGRRCVYCGAEGVRLHVEHVLARAKGGTDVLSNLAISCRPCNEAKGTRDVREFVMDSTILAKLLHGLRMNFSDIAAVNITRNALKGKLEALGLPVSCYSGARTKHNRERLALAKSHVADAVCVGDVVTLVDRTKDRLVISCTGRGSYKRTRLDANGFPRGSHLPKRKHVQGFRTGDLVRAMIPKGVYAGRWVGRVAVKTSGDFVVTTAGVKRWVRHTRCTLLRRADDYGYNIVRDVTPQRVMQIE